MAGRLDADRGVASARWEALGTSVDMRVGDVCALPHARAQVERELDAIDLACSRFRADSELSHLNACAGHPVQVSALLLEALDLAVAAAALTDGDVDPTVGRALQLGGYDRDWRRLSPARGEPAASGLSLHALIGWRTISIDRADSTVRIPAGVRLDLGATAKAWAADRAAAAASAAVDGGGVLVSLGGDVAACGSAPHGGWQIRVTDDHRSGPEAAGQTIAIRGGGLATSSTSVRRWSHAGRTMHHIIDPRTGLPARGRWRTVSVAAQDCAQANIATTAALVRDGGALDWLTRQKLPARLVAWDGAVRTVCAWPAGEQTETQAMAVAR